ncbi:MAG: MBL fold metallo-hydrolase [Pseudomonadota bacterium]
MKDADNPNPFTLEFFGAAGEVTGSCHILTVNGDKILLDCGMIQGGRENEARNRDSFPFDASAIHAVVLSHAHLDHSGRLPLLAKRGFRGPVHTHHASKDLCHVLLADAASLGERDAERHSERRARQGKPPVAPLYTRSDAKRVTALLEGHRYHQTFAVTPNINVTFHDAGHIMGSAIVEVEISLDSITTRLVFSGDVGQYDTPVLHDPQPVLDADLIIMESTYGGRRHREREQTFEEIGDILKAAADDGGNVLIPAFAIGRSQELLYLFGKNFDAWQMSRWRIFLDSPMAIEASEIYWNYPHLYDDEATRLRRTHDEMPLLKNLYLTRTGAESRVINRLPGGSIILAGSGMCNGGRILHHLKHNLWRKNTHVLMVGYQGRGSLGRRLVDGDDEVRIHGQTIQVAAKVHTVGGLSAHGDEQDLSRWYGSCGGQPPVWLVHGEPRASARLATRLHEDHGARVTQASPGMHIDLNTLAPRHA